jgi:UDP-N-acetylglucosamine:LPS N-acetylglucosamine transferase
VRILRKTLMDIKPDMVVSFLVSINIVLILATALTGLSVIISERDDPWESKENAFWILARKWFYPWADAIVVHTQQSKLFFPRIIWNKIFPIPNPLMVPIDLPPKVNYGLQKKIISIGRLSKVSIGTRKSE